jgi:GNAT superfamily N-acetyltransferase
MEVRYRALEPDEIGTAADVFMVTVQDLVQRLALPPVPFTRQNMIPVYDHLRKTGIFEVAVVDGRIASIGAAFVRGDVWFLSMFWTLPDVQRIGIGRPLLDRIWQRGIEAGATRHFVWSSVDPTAIATYLRKGMLPGCQILGFVGAPRPASPSSTRAPLAGYAAFELDARIADNLDREVRGAERPIDHGFWAADAETVRRSVILGDRAVGYSVARKGIIGPAAWSADEHADAVLAHALADARTQASEVRLSALGCNHAAIRFALGSGLRLTGSAHLLMSAPIGAFNRYVPSGPALF